MLIIENDEAFFRRNPTRQARIRRASQNEMTGEFSQVKPHGKDQRRIIAWKVPFNVPAPYKGWAGRVIRIPFVQEPTEEIEDNDRTVMRLIEELMSEASKEYGLQQ
jgi:hypothetical protein